MATNLEKQFFDTFGVEPKTNQVYGMQLDYHIEDYPQITDSILVELICLCNRHCLYCLWSKNKEDLKDEVLEKCTNLLGYYWDSLTSPSREELKKTVQALFKEG